jgi:hypothetical protein
VCAAEGEEILSGVEILESVEKAEMYMIKKFKLWPVFEIRWRIMSSRKAAR